MTVHLVVTRGITCTTQCITCDISGWCYKVNLGPFNDPSFETVTVQRIYETRNDMSHEIIHTELKILTQAGHAPRLTVPNPGTGMEQQEVCWHVLEYFRRHICNDIFILVIPLGEILVCVEVVIHQYFVSHGDLGYGHNDSLCGWNVVRLQVEAHNVPPPPPWR